MLLATDFDLQLIKFDTPMNINGIQAIHVCYNKVGFDVVSLSGWFVVCVIVSVDNERNIEVS